MLSELKLIFLAAVQPSYIAYLEIGLKLGHGDILDEVLEG